MKQLIKKFIFLLAGKTNFRSDVKALHKYRKKYNAGGVAKTYWQAKSNHICCKNGAFIPVTVQMGKDIVFPHGLCGIFISGGAVIGDGCTIFHQVTIGSNNLSDSDGYGAPVIGNNVFIGAGAKIIGNVHIGDNVRIGANCVVTKDVPDNATVVLSSPRVIEHSEPRNNIFEKFEK